MNRAPLVALLFVMGALPAAPAFSQESRCADCHFARPDAPGQSHLMQWDRSPHGRANVGCEKCHRGNPATFESFLAHRDIVDPASPKSPVNRRNLPSTCGVCHIGPYVAFQKSHHYDLLQAADSRGPTCSTCHGEVDGRLLSAKALESRCAGCHGEDEKAPRADRARLVRELYGEVSAVRGQLKLARSLIRRVDDKARRARLEEVFQQAEVPLTEAVQAGHEFMYENLRERLDVARTRVQSLLARLANP